MSRLRSTLTLLFALLLVLGSGAFAAPISPGFDLFNTPPGGGELPGGVIPGLDDPIPLVGLPFGPGNTDTIVQRTTGLGDNQTGVIEAELIALSLTSISPVNIGGSFFDVFVTLDPDLDSKGTINVLTHDDGGGTFDSHFDVFALVTLTEVGNPSNSMTKSHADEINSFGSLWSHRPALGYVGGGRFPAGGFYPGVDPLTLIIVGVEHDGPHPENIPSTPEPATWLSLGSAAIALALVRRRTSRY